MGTTTTNLALYKPTVGETGWGEEVNASLDTVDGNYREMYVRYVDYQNGSDSNNGRSPSLAFQTIQAAYNNLKTQAEADVTASILPIGTLQLAPGLHDVGTGVTIAANRPCLIRGLRGGLVDGAYINETAPIIYSSGTPAFLIQYGTTSSQVRGLEIEDVGFQITTSQTCAVKLRCVNHFRMERCSARPTASAHTGYMVDVNNDSPGGDGSWGNIIHCGANQMGLIKIDTTGQTNYWRILNNHVTYGLGVAAGIWLYSTNAIVACEVSGNHLEAGTGASGPAIYTRGTSNCTFINNFGEAKDVNYPFYDFGGTNNIVIGGRCTSDTSGTSGMFVTTTATANYNTFILPGIKPASDAVSTSVKDRFTDSNASSASKWLGNEFLDVEKGWVEMEARSAPANPPSGFRRVFSDSGGSSAASVRTSAGVTTSLET